MYTKDELTNPKSPFEYRTEPYLRPVADKVAKKKFVEPEISVPVDVLEATTFFQGITSGVVIP